MKNYFQCSTESPYHVSVGAVLLNEDRKVACHYFEQTKGFRNIYILMRESMETGESIEGTLHRGLKEELGAKAEIETYIGSKIVHFDKIEENIFDIQKTTLYFLCNVKSQDGRVRSKRDVEKGSQIQWHTIKDLIELMEKHEKVITGEVVNEADILRRAKSYLEAN